MQLMQSDGEAYTETGSVAPWGPPVWCGGYGPPDPPSECQQAVTKEGKMCVCVVCVLLLLKSIKCTVVQWGAF